jgi:cytidine deaminase
MFFQVHPDWEEAYRIQRRCEAMCSKLADQLRTTMPRPDRQQALGLMPLVMTQACAIAATARDLGISYRGFKVGAVLIGIREQVCADDHPWVITCGANWKPNPESEKKCSEDAATEIALSRRLSHALGYFVSAIPQTDDESRTAQDVLTPCGKCRQQIRAHMSGEDPIIQKDTFIGCSHVSDRSRRWRGTVATLHTLHCEAID